MTKESYAVTVYLDVYDPEQLWQAARAHYRGENPTRTVPVEELDEMFGDGKDPDDPYDISGCLRQIIDPGSMDGCDIHDSAVEHEGTVGDSGELLPA